MNSIYNNKSGRAFFKALTGSLVIFSSTLYVQAGNEAHEYVMQALQDDAKLNLGKLLIYTNIRSKKLGLEQITVHGDCNFLLPADFYDEEKTLEIGGKIKKIETPEQLRNVIDKVASLSLKKSTILELIPADEREALAKMARCLEDTKNLGKDPSSDPYFLVLSHCLVNEMGYYLQVICPVFGVKIPSDLLKNMNVFRNSSMKKISRESLYVFIWQPARLEHKKV